jgi:putative oxidoreductase
MSVLVLIGRIVFSVLFLYSAVGHLTQTKGMSQYAASRGVPAAYAATLLGGIPLLLGGLSVLLGIWADLGALLLALFLFPTAVLMHGFWKEKDQQARMTEQVAFLKDSALGGAALALLGLFVIAGDELGLTITGPLFG